MVEERFVTEHKRRDLVNEIEETLKEAMQEQAQLLLSSSFLPGSRLFERVAAIIRMDFRLSSTTSVEANFFYPCPWHLAGRP